jgi:hydrogenase maturation protein HypF
LEELLNISDMTPHPVAKRLEVNGIVQGVGFRPFVYQLAIHYGLMGEVANTSAGVSIHVEGAPELIASFENDLSAKCPPLAYITEVSSFREKFRNFRQFTIAKSKGQAFISTLISPDMAICDDCLRELFDPGDRRYRYPFINCTNCGPRYTIIDDIPYDRPKTSMKHFHMCSKCQAEYDNPLDRRFHAQPNACADCGPHVTLTDSRQRPLAALDPIEHAADLLKRGYILAIKGLGGFHLAADAENTEAVTRLRQLKMREEKPFAVMSYDVDSIRRYARVTPEEEALLTSPRRPIVLLEKKGANSLSEQLAPRNKYFGVMLPYTPLHYLMLAEGFSALVMTSGNLSEEPIAVDNDDAFFRLADIADFFLVHNRDIYLRSDDSIVKRTAGVARCIRRSRGYVPMPVFLRGKVPSVLACGAELKNTVCLTKRDKAFLSQHIGDLENLATYDFFQLTIAHMKRILDVKPELIAYDLHPDYLSTRFAAEQGQLPIFGVQHHHAHIVSCMAEHKLEGAVIGLSFDGTGYGTDGTVWGGEILLTQLDRFERIGYLSPAALPGGAAAIKEPWRMAVSYLYTTFGNEFRNLNLPLFAEIDSLKINTMVEMIDKGLNCPLTSSLGRLFDGVAAIVGIRNRVNFEGQAAMELEMLASDDSEAAYDTEWVTEGHAKRILIAPIVRGIVRDIQKGVPAPRISANFHHSLIRLFSDVCEDVRRQNGLERVVLSGGVFQNSILLAGLSKALAGRGFEVFSHEKVPTNDGGIALGQAIVAASAATA